MSYVYENILRVYFGFGVNILNRKKIDLVKRFLRSLLGLVFKVIIIILIIYKKLRLEVLRVGF